MAVTDRIVRRSPDRGELTLSVTYDETVFLIELFGELDFDTASELQLVIARAEGTEAKEILVDLSGLEFIDSAGIVALVRAVRRSRGNGSPLRLLRGTGQVDRVMTLCGLHDRLPFLD